MAEDGGTSLGLLSHKVPDSELRAFAEGGPADEDRSVIIELASRPDTLLRTREVPRKGRIRPAPPSPALTLQGRSMDQLERQIEAIVARKRVRLDAAEAFVVSVRPTELRALLRLALVGFVRPNRTHRV